MRIVTVGKWALGGVGVLGVLTTAAAVIVVTTPYAGFQGELLVDLPRGMTTREMARRLAERGVIRGEGAFLAIRLVRPRARLQAGEYEFRQAATPWEVFERIHRGDVHYYELTIPEGSNRWEVARLVGQLGFLREEDFVRATGEAKWIQDLAPEATTLEGYLFPSTYRITRHTTAEQLARMMTEQFRVEWKRLGRPAEVHRLVTLASLVEKETGVAEERATVASVYRNRLERGMRLECDPTVIYAALLENRYRGTIYRSDLENPHPYNTYKHAGLPPGPIANPGRAALEAALKPAETDYLFFVARPDGSGRHQFTAALRDHERAVREYRRGNASRQSEAAGGGVGGSTGGARR
jgi:UPF0755 protein